MGANIEIGTVIVGIVGALYLLVLVVSFFKGALDEKDVIPKCLKQSVIIAGALGFINGIQGMLYSYSTSHPDALAIYVIDENNMVWGSMRSLLVCVVVILLSIPIYMLASKRRTIKKSRVTRILEKTSAALIAVISTVLLASQISKTLLHIVVQP